jgi:hypothetical protein
MEPIRKGTIPPILLGVRGSNYTEKPDGTFYIPDDVYIVDGQQRRAAAEMLLRQDCDSNPQLGATLFFGTNEEVERDLFTEYNTTGLRLSPNVVLRAHAKKFPIVQAMFDLTETSRHFAGFGRVCWNQKMTKGQVINARTFASVACHLHVKLGSAKAGRVKEMSIVLQRCADRIGERRIIENLVTFYDLIDHCWGLRRLVITTHATQIREGFLLVLARMLSTFPQFWEHPNKASETEGLKSRLVISAQHRQRLATFPLDAEVARLAASSGTTAVLLYGILLEHMNKRMRYKLIDPSLTQLESSNGNGCDGEEEDAA